MPREPIRNLAKRIAEHVAVCDPNGYFDIAKAALIVEELLEPYKVGNLVSIPMTPVEDANTPFTLELPAYSRITIGHNHKTGPTPSRMKIMKKLNDNYFDAAFVLACTDCEDSINVCINET